jgi:hypothetical protein
MTSTDGNVVTPTYSTDGATWLPITTSSGTAAPRDLTGITAPKVGLLGLGSTAAGAADNIQAKFDYFTITPDDTATPCSSGNTCLDTFDGNALGNTWEVVRPDRQHHRRRWQPHHPDGRHRPVPDHQHHR